MRIIPSSYFFAIIMRSARLAVGTVGALMYPPLACRPRQRRAIRRSP